ncbi:alpha/beta hydrolase [Cognatilysobacter lacus]|uniref:Alpha/beta hydrolase n=1 Tax=Cognatilysobacter lacus TaxID=1643323 RepID=A0A5D8YX94_9GAMM|nr:alpha/beta hydrolase [Lysobacter lacus]TZF87151.1 alpha/beta hydrolase [Lysobacter lacus]
MRLRSLFAPALVALFALGSSGCERAIFAAANRGVRPPEATVVFSQATGLSLDVYRPHDADGRAPVVVFFYGGGWTRGERAQYRFVGRRLAEGGVLTIVADYRTWPRAGFPAFVDDAAQAVAWANQHASQYGGDPSRVFVAGHSAGAQIAALVGADARYLAPYGLKPHDLAGVIGLSGPYDFVVGTKYAAIFGAPSQWPAAQAVNAVDGDEPPFLLVHATGDRVVDPADSQEMADRLRKAGVRADLLMVPGGGHTTPLQGLYSPHRVPAVLPAILRFVAAPNG